MSIMPANNRLLGVAVVFVLYSSMCSSNQMDPHLFPDKGPFFEGWYMRIMDQHRDFSVGWLFSRILADKTHRLKNPCINPSLEPYSSQCVGDPLPLSLQTEWKAKNGNNSTIPIPYFTNAIILINKNKASKLTTNIEYFPLSEYAITKDGHPITRNPDDKSPPHFEAKIGKNVSFIVRPNGTHFYLNLGNTIVKGETDRPVPWGPYGEGPESWIDKLPLPLHWFVYSLRSNVLNYQVIDKANGLFINGGSTKDKPVLAHMEKNWGADFPKAWFWAQGVDAKTNASFAVSSGLLTELGLDIPAQLSNYRNPSKGIDCKFHPANSVHLAHQDGCSGKADIRVTGLMCEVIFEFYTKPEFLSDCLTTPQTFGYSLGCVESYNAVANITVYQREGFQMKFVDSHQFSMAALEFGGEYMCHGKCPKNL